MGFFREYRLNLPVRATEVVAFFRNYCDTHGYRCVASGSNSTDKLVVAHRKFPFVLLPKNARRYEITVQNHVENTSRVCLRLTRTTLTQVVHILESAILAIGIALVVAYPLKDLLTRLANDPMPIFDLWNLGLLLLLIVLVASICWLARKVLNAPRYLSLLLWMSIFSVMGERKTAKYINVSVLLHRFVQR